jgi:hypothetical protein
LSSQALEPSAIGHAYVARHMVARRDEKYLSKLATPESMNVELMR